MNNKKIGLALVAMVSLGLPASLAAQEAVELPPIEIQIHPEPWKKTETELPPRSFAPKDLPELIEELLTYNPQLQALLEKIRALENLIDPAGSLEDPRFSFEGSNIPISPPALNRTPMTGLQIYYRQKVPWPGKLKLKKQIARSRYEQQQQAYYEELNQLVAKFKQTYYDYRLATEWLQIYESTTAKFSGLGKILEARYSAGDTPQQDILQNKVEISSLQQTMVELKQRQKILRARMNTLLNRPVEQALKITGEKNQPTRLQASLPDLRKIAQRTRPWLKKSTLEIEQADYEHRLAKKSLLPDFDFAAGWRFRQGSPGDPVAGEDFFSAGFQMNLPMFAHKKQNQEIAAAYHHKKYQEHLQQATTQEVLYQVEDTFHRLEQLKSQLNLVNRQTLPQARAAVDSARVGYEAEQVDFLNVLTNEVSLLQQRLKQSQYRYEYEKKMAELEMVTGLPIHVLNEWGKEKQDEKS